jgi:hypothetical protein
MAEGRQEFERQLRELGYQPELLDTDRLTIPYTIPSGNFANRQVKLGFVVPTTFPRETPSGPHVSPRLKPNNGTNSHPEKVAESDFKGDWMYLSRPFHGKWNSKRGVSGYLAHVFLILETL